MRHVNLRLTIGMYVFVAVLQTSKCAISQEPVNAVAEVPPLVVIDGDPVRRGQLYGRQFRNEIREFLDREIYTAFIGKPSSKDELLRYAAACGQVVRTACPLIAAEVEGIAHGAGLTYDEVILIHLHEELYHRAPLPTSQPTIARSTTAPKDGHCTAVAVAPTSSGDGRTYVGQTWDWMASVAGKSRIVQWRRSDAASVLAYGFPGMPMGAGLNSHGIALCWTSAALGEKSQVPRIGLPSYILIAHLLAQPDMTSVIREAERKLHAGWFTFVLADGIGTLVNIEGSPTRVSVEKSGSRLVRVGYGCRDMLNIKPTEPIPFHARCQLMFDHLGKTDGKNDLIQLKSYFSNANFKINVGKSTIDMMIFDTTSRSAYLSRGTSYNLKWHKFQFQ